MKTKYIFFLLLLLGCKKDDFLPVTPVGISLKSISVSNHLDTLVISKTHRIEITGTYTDGSTKNLTDSVVVSVNSDKLIKIDNQLLGVKSGVGTYNISYKNLYIKDSSYVSEIEYVNVPELKPRSGTSIVVPVVVINYLPTNDGVNLDMNRAPDNYFNLQNSTLDRAKNKIKTDLIITKYGIEEGSKFRGFNNSSATPNVGIKVVKYYNIYEIKKVMSADKINYFVDFNNMFSKLNLKDAINNLGAKEVWFSLRPLSSEYPIVKSENLSPENFQAGGPESNMSSPTSGDVSNSWRIADDLPIYDKSYVVYTYNLHRSHAENIHNHGHQIESQLDYLDEGTFSKDERLFLNKFVGISNINLAGKPYGRNGMTHFPPNTKKDYDWNNTSIVKSDIDDWKPEGGTQKDIDNTKWMSIKYTYPNVAYKIDENDSQYKWIMFWFQTIPGNSNGIKYGNNTISNWWDLLYNWDDAVKGKKKLFE